MKPTYWLYGFGFFGLAAPVILLLLQRGGVGISAHLVVSIWPTFILAAIGVLGMRGWWAWGFTILLNGICYGAFGYLSGQLWRKLAELRARRSDDAI
jgi:hypothetical protein